jgi:hypothetical protein
VEFFERIGVGAPKTLTAEFFSSHPSTPERTVTARKVVASLVEQGVYKPQAQQLSAPTRTEDADDGEQKEKRVRPSVAAPLQKQFDKEDSFSTEKKLRILYRDFRAGRISEADYEARKRALLGKE